MDKISGTNWMIIGIVVVLLISGGWWLMNRETAMTPEIENESSEEVSTDNSSPTVPVTPSAGGSITSNEEAVSVPDQASGEQVTVSSVKFSAPGWVAVRDDRGWTLGASRFEAGIHTNVTVKLLRGTTAGERYQVLLYIDDGDGAFDLEKEILVTRNDGSVAGAIFTAQ